MITDELRLERLQKNLLDVVHGRIFVKSLLSEKMAPSPYRREIGHKQATKIELDNDVSAFYTVIDVMTQDRVGLLYQITSTFYSLGLYVEVAKVLTKANVVNDIFYVKDIFGQKILSDERLQKIRARLYEVIEGGGTIKSDN